MKKAKVVIIGAGMAGLGAALKLHRNGMNDFLIIEAQNQAGGRIESVEVNGKFVDLGAQWIHGSQNLLYKLASKHGLLSEEVSVEGLGIYIRDDGNVVDEFLVKKIDFEVGIMLEECLSFIDHHEYPDSMEEFFTRKFEEFLESPVYCDKPDEVKQTTALLFDWHLRFQTIDNSCCGLNSISAKLWGTYKCGDTTHYNLRRGYGSLIDVILSYIPKENIIYNTPLTNVIYDQSQILLTCDKIDVVCDHLILTPSLGFLKDFQHISPPLPSSINSSINALGFYAIGKILLFFEDRWWGDIQGFQLLWRSETNLPKEEEWFRHITGFENLFNHPNALVGWIGGPGVPALEQLDEYTVGNICVQVLRRFLPNFIIPEPVKVMR